MRLSPKMLAALAALPAACLMAPGCSTPNGRSPRTKADAAPRLVATVRRAGGGGAGQAANEKARGAVTADKAAIDNIRLQLNYCSIRSPIDGRTGNLAIKQGNLVKATDVELVTINQVHPIYVTFSVPEDRLPEIKRHMAQGNLAVLAYRPSETTALGQGSITFIDNAIDPTTGTIK